MIVVLVLFGWMTYDVTAVNQIYRSAVIEVGVITTAIIMMMLVLYVI